MNVITCDGIIRIQNGYKRGLKQVTLRKSKFMMNILNVLKQEGYIEDYMEETKLMGNIIVKLRYWQGNPAIKYLKFISVPSHTVYGSHIKPFHNFGIVIMSTNKGVMTSYNAQKENVGGKILMEVF